MPLGCSCEVTSRLATRFQLLYVPGPPMKSLRFVAAGSASVVLLACEPHPLPGEPPAAGGHGGRGAQAEQHEGGKQPSQLENRDAAAQPSVTAPENQKLPSNELARPEDDRGAAGERKFFPEKK